MFDKKGAVFVCVAVGVGSVVSRGLAPSTEPLVCVCAYLKQCRVFLGPRLGARRRDRVLAVAAAPPRLGRTGKIELLAGSVCDMCVRMC